MPRLSNTRHGDHPDDSAEGEPRDGRFQQFEDALLRLAFQLFDEGQRALRQGLRLIRMQPPVFALSRVHRQVVEERPRLREDFGGDGRDRA